MEIYEIYNLDCSKKENRKILLNETIKVLGLDEKPTKEELKKYCKMVKAKYKIKMSSKKLENGYQINLEVERYGYSVFKCITPFEAMCKYILFCKAWKKVRGG